MNIESEITAAENERITSLLQEDIPAFAELCDDRLTYTHSVGRRDNKTTLLQALAAGVVRYLSIDHRLDEICPLDDVALVHGTMHAEIQTSGRRLRLATLTTSVWARHPEGWKLLSFHAVTQS